MQEAPHSPALGGGSCGLLCDGVPGKTDLLGMLAGTLTGVASSLGPVSAGALPPQPYADPPALRLRCTHCVSKPCLPGGAPPIHGARSGFVSLLRCVP